MNPTSPQQARRQRILGELPEKKAAALLVSSIVNVRYLTGFTGSNAMLLLAPGTELLLTDPRYALQAPREADCKVKVVRGPVLEAVLKTIGKQRWRRIAVESNDLRMNTAAALREKLPSGTALVPVAGWVESLRMVKSAEEIAAIRRSVELDSRAFDAALPLIRPDMTERELAAEIDYQMRRLGAERTAFETIVAAGAGSALPHHRPGGAPIGANRLLLIDMGASVDGYSSDMTRTVFLGRPEKKAAALYDAVLEAQLAAIDAVRPGISGMRLDRVARDVLAARGLAKEFQHSTGHGLGLEIHEPPRIGKKEKTRLEAGMTITIEPGAYLEDYGGVRIEDTVLVTARGCEVLTPTAKARLVL